MHNFHILDSNNGIKQNHNTNDSNGELSLDELENIMDLVHDKEKRIQELENALRESVRIVAERETVLQQEESRRKQIMDKVLIKLGSYLASDGRRMKAKSEVWIKQLKKEKKSRLHWDSGQYQF